jgi:hypothetical protein
MANILGTFACQSFWRIYTSLLHKFYGGIVSNIRIHESFDTKKKKKKKKALKMEIEKT